MTVPDHLKINDRQEDQTFTPTCKLYRAFRRDEFDTLENTILLESIRFPDFSTNWDRYSAAEDIKYRRNGRDTDGCYSFTVATAQHKDIAKPVHEPIDDPEFSNYAHVEVRVCKVGDLPDVLPAKGRKLNSKTKKLEYRQNLANHAAVEFMATE